jgi:3-dehydroquinate dehydratase
MLDATPQLRVHTTVIIRLDFIHASMALAAKVLGMVRLVVINLHFSNVHRFPIEGNLRLSAPIFRRRFLF